MTAFWHLSGRMEEQALSIGDVGGASNSTADMLVRRVSGMGIHPTQAHDSRSCAARCEVIVHKRSRNALISVIASPAAAISPFKGMQQIPSPGELVTIRCEKTCARHNMSGCQWVTGGSNGRLDKKAIALDYIVLPCKPADSLSVGRGK